MKGQPLDGEETEFYEKATSLKEKIEWATERVKSLVDQGKLTSAEKADVIQAIEGRIEKVLLKANSSSGKAQARMEARAAEMKERLDRVRAVSPEKNLWPLEPHYDDLRELWKKILKLDKEGDTTSFNRQDKDEAFAGLVEECRDF